MRPLTLRETVAVEERIVGRPMIMADPLASVLSGSTTWHVANRDVLDGLRSLPDSCVQCVVTSPPYWALRDYGVDGQIGLEESPDEFLAKLVEVFAEVRRVLRDDGTLWLNIGDSYSQDGKWGGSSSNKNETEQGYPRHRRTSGCKPKDRMFMPHRLVLALQADGWWARDEIVWHKPSPMPESVRDRTTKSHEFIFLLTKRSKYFYDQEGSRESFVTPGPNNPYPTTDDYNARPAGDTKRDAFVAANSTMRTRPPSRPNGCIGPEGGRNMRSVWTLAPEPCSEAHFATYPTELVRKCLLAGVSSKGCCPMCGAPWLRIVSRERVRTRPGKYSKAYDRTNGQSINDMQEKPWQAVEVGNRDPGRHVTKTETTGWEPGCKCESADPIGCVALDPFTGSGTTGIVARKMGCRFVGFELNSDYHKMACRRIADDAPLFNAV